MNMNSDIRELPREINQTGSMSSSSDEIKQQRRMIVGIIIAAIVIITILILSLVFLFSPNTTPTTVARIRDVFIIMMAVESVFVGVVLVILMIQLARLINLLQNEVQPILDSTNETVSNLRGTTEFLSTNLTEPIIKLNEYLAGLQKLVELLSFRRKK